MAESTFGLKGEALREYVEEARCKDCGISRSHGPCPCSFPGNGVAAYYQRKHRERLAALEKVNA